MPGRTITSSRTGPARWTSRSIASTASRAMGPGRPRREFRPFYSPPTSARGMPSPAYYSVHGSRGASPRASARRDRVRATSAARSIVNLVDAPMRPGRASCVSSRSPDSAPTGICRCRCRSGPARRISRSRSAPRAGGAGGGRADAAAALACPRGHRLAPHQPSVAQLSLDRRQRRRHRRGGLRELLALYADLANADVRKQVEGLRGVASRPIVRRLPGVRPVTYARGLEISLIATRRPSRAPASSSWGRARALLCALLLDQQLYRDPAQDRPRRGDAMASDDRPPTDPVRAPAAPCSGRSCARSRAAPAPATPNPALPDRA
jgi:hypothetical protein